MATVAKSIVDSYHLRSATEDMLRHKGYTHVNRNIFDNIKEKGNKIYTKGYMVNEFYGTKREVNYILYNPKLTPDCICIQCRWQGKNGTTYQKYLYEVESIRKGGYDTIIIVDGGAYKPEARKWLVAQSKAQKSLMNVFSWKEFCQFVRGGGL